jgi:SAM-dependent methyltransferase
VLDRVGFAWLCEGISRHEDPEYVSRVISRQLFSYFQPSDFAGKRLLDFGCGSGASTFALAKMLPATEVIGVELEGPYMEMAEAIRSFRKLPSVRFFKSPHGQSIPDALGSFDFVVLSAVYEHLLPVERKLLMPMLWASINPGGVLFINQTPHRYCPYETHSTRLWLINYLPDRLACFAASRFSRYNQEINRNRNWQDHLRGGLRGGTEREVLRNVSGSAGGKAWILQPTQNGLRDRADYWLAGTNPTRYRLLKRVLSSAFRVTDRVFGAVPGTHIDVVIQKENKVGEPGSPAPSAHSLGERAS